MIIDTTQSGSLGSSGIFSPRDLGINIALDAANPAGNLIIPADGTSLASIADIGVNNEAFVQATGASQPVFKKNIINGQNVFRLSGTQFATCPNSSKNSYTAGGALTVFVIAASTTITGTGMIYTKGSPAGYMMGRDTTHTRFTSVGLVDKNTASTDWAANTFKVYGWQYASASINFYTNRSLVQTTATTAPGASTQQLVFGADYNLSGAFTGDIVAIFIAFRQLATWEINLMLDYCCARIGL